MAVPSGVSAVLAKPPLQVQPVATSSSSANVSFETGAFVPTSRADDPTAFAGVSPLMIAGVAGLAFWAWKQGLFK